MSKNEQTPPPPGPPPGPHDNKLIRKITENGKSVGVGDTVSKIIKAMSFGKVEECTKCKKRKEKLNDMFPYKKNEDEEQIQDD